MSDVKPLHIINAHENNLKHLNLDIPHDSLTVVTGLSGSGKSSLAFDTVFAEGQRRFIETFSPYTRQFLDKAKKPDVDALENVRAAIAIQQKTKVTNSRSTVGSMTDILEYLKIIWANLSVPFCPICGKKLQSWSSDTLRDEIQRQQKVSPNSTFYICMPFLEKTAKGLKAEIEKFIMLGFSRTIDTTTGEFTLLEDLSATKLQRSLANTLILIDRIRPHTPEFPSKRVRDSIEQAFNLGKGYVTVIESTDDGTLSADTYYNYPTCQEHNIELPKVKPALFSYNHPQGSCPVCKGFGKILTIGRDKCVPDKNLSIKEGAIHCWHSKNTTYEFNKLINFCKENSISITTPWKDLLPEEQDLIFNTRKRGYCGVNPWFKMIESMIYKMHVRVFLSRYRTEELCPNCNGSRFKPEILAYKINGYDIASIRDLSVEKLLNWLEEIHKEAKTRVNYSKELDEVLKTCISRVSILSSLGLPYLTLNRQSKTLSGGETQRVNLAAALGSHLTSTEFVLDEPSVGLHAHDTEKLISAIHDLRDRGNSVLVVEHDTDCIAAADNIIEIGPESGSNGGEIVYSGPAKNWNGGRVVDYSECLAHQKLLCPVETTQGDLKRNPHFDDNCPAGTIQGNLKQDPHYDDTCPAGTIQGSRRRPLLGWGPHFSDTAPSAPRRGATTKTLEFDGDYIEIKNANVRNLKDLNVKIPLNSLVCLSGVSGSGKSTLASEVLLHEYEAMQNGEPSHTTVLGFEKIKQLLLVDQSALTKAPRSNIATYCGFWNEIREALASTEDAKIRKLKAADFSFNSGKGRCPECNGAGYIKEDMQFLSDVYMPCEKCLGKRFKEIVLEVKYKGYTVSDFLNMSVTKCREVFPESRNIEKSCKTLELLGLGHLSLGHSLSELSGGEAQRLKLIPFINKSGTSKSFLIFDEPTTGLHTADVINLIRLLQTLRDNGHSILVIEHNLTFLSLADWIIDLGPYGGERGGEVIKVGTPADFISDKKTKSLTAKHLKLHLESSDKPFKAKVTKASTSNTCKAITIKGAKENNLKNIDLQIPLHKFVALTGVSGSGKSSIAKDILYAEGQRRYLDCLSPYARQFIKELKRPNVDYISNILPTICVYQHTFQPSHLSTIASMSEIYNYLRLLYSKTAVQYCPDHPSERITPLTADDITEELKQFDEKVYVLAPIIKSKKGIHTNIFERALQSEITHVRVDGQIAKTSAFSDGLKKTVPHTIEYVVGIFNPKNTASDIIKDCITQALNLSTDSSVIIFTDKDTIYSSSRSCSICKRGFFKPDPEDLSFNSTRGKCPDCGGYGIYDNGEVCETCHGARINEVAANLRINGLNIHELCLKTAPELLRFINKLHFNAAQQKITETVLTELHSRLECLIKIGLDYLPLDRSCDTLSGGELQRLRLATAIGSPLTGILYIFDEPSAGLHPTDNQKVLSLIKDLKNRGNSIIMIEHDEESILASDYVIDIGPAAGKNGGEIVAEAPLKEFLNNKTSITAAALRNEIQLPEEEELEPNGVMQISNANKNNIKKLDLTLPLGVITSICGVSGAGKSSLMHGIIKETLENGKAKGTNYKLGKTEISLSYPFEKILAIDQKPIGANSRSTPASYLGIWDEIRKLFAKTPEAQARGWNASYFSYNTGKGRCPTCEGKGEITLQMSFLADAKVVCEDCRGSRFLEELKTVKFADYSIADVLNMTFEEAAQVFANHYKISHLLHGACEIGLGYITLGQSSTTLSGGECQRLKLVTELSARRRGKTLYLLDEPTIGLHRADVLRLMKILHRLTNQGHTVLIIEHDKDVIQSSDYVITLGPGAGEAGGKVISNTFKYKAVI